MTDTPSSFIAMGASIGINLRTGVLLCLLASSVAFGADGAASGSKRSPQQLGSQCHSLAVPSCKVYQSLGRGINMGNALDAPREGQFGVSIKPEYIQAIKEAGFDHVRLPVRWSNHAAETADATLSQEFLGRVDEIVDQILGSGMIVILDFHSHRQLVGGRLDSNEMEVAQDVLEDRFVNIWIQLSRHYLSRSNKIVFEIFNEPHGALTADRWNHLFARTVRAIRRIDDHRLLIGGPVGWNSAFELEKLRTPVDSNLIVTIHQYAPHKFSHQGAWGSKVPGGSVACCDQMDVAAMKGALDTAAAWSKKHGVPIYVGEFGAHVSASVEHRESFFREMRTLLEEHSFPWAAWNFGSDFGIYDIRKNSWNTRLLDSLLN